MLLQRGMSGGENPYHIFVRLKFSAKYIWEKNNSGQG